MSSAPAIQRYTQEELEHMDIRVLDRLAFGFTNDEVVILRPDQIRIKHPGDLENPDHQFALRGMTWARSVDLSEPVAVSVAEDGGLDLEDGHHRWVAAGKTGRSLRALIEIKGNPVRRILWQQEQQATRQPSPARSPRRRR